MDSWSSSLSSQPDQWMRIAAALAPSSLQGPLGATAGMTELGMQGVRGQQYLDAYRALRSGGTDVLLDPSGLDIAYGGAGKAMSDDVIKRVMEGPPRGTLDIAGSTAGGLRQAADRWLWNRPQAGASPVGAVPTASALQDPRAPRGVLPGPWPPRMAGTQPSLDQVVQMLMAQRRGGF